MREEDKKNGAKLRENFVNESLKITALYRRSPMSSDLDVESKAKRQPTNQPDKLSLVPGVKNDLVRTTYVIYAVCQSLATKLSVSLLNPTPPVSTGNRNASARCAGGLA